MPAFFPQVQPLAVFAPSPSPTRARQLACTLCCLLGSSVARHVCVRCLPHKKCVQAPLAGLSHAFPDAGVLQESPRTPTAVAQGRAWVKRAITGQGASLGALSAAAAAAVPAWVPPLPGWGLPAGHAALDPRGSYPRAAPPSAVPSGAPAAAEEGLVDQGGERRSSAAGDAHAAGASSSAAGSAAVEMSDEVVAKRQRSRDSAAAMQPLPLPEVRL